MSKLGKKIETVADNAAAAIVYTGLLIGGETGAKAAGKVTEVTLGREFDIDGWRADQPKR